ncbi:low molecular weight phosphotyrosine protein phosphatase [Nocardioides sp. MJB4]|uniref:protein-tyrosine-phosphatase n=2 Tax=Nocardioides donggukensis TaxID=2774019 RepID=A0A927K5B9_9ACTN|nr:low molecular weight phosphotyrosine protein phosphatase [Nocardioides donggukensis]
MAHVVLDARLADAGLADRVRVDSAGTAGWHVGRGMDERAAAALAAAGLDPTRHRAARFTGDRVGEHDLVLAMDHANLEDLARLGVDPDRLRLFRDLDPEPGDGAVPDPYYGDDDGFAAVLGMVERTAEALVAGLTELLPGSGAATGSGAGRTDQA